VWSPEYAEVLRPLVENEILRLNVWNNPTSDPRRGIDSTGTVERTMSDVSSLVMVPSSEVADTLSTDDADDICETNLANESWDCHLFDGAILCAHIGGRGHSSRAVQPTCLH
jgi:hypothetical protein